MNRHLLYTLVAVITALFATHKAHAIESYEADSVAVVYLVKDVTPQAVTKAAEAAGFSTAGASLLCDKPEKCSSLLWTELANTTLGDDEVALPVPAGYHLEEFLMGKPLLDCNPLFVFAVYDRNAITGYDGAITALAMSSATLRGKSLMLTVGATDMHTEVADHTPEHDARLESISDAAAAMMQAMNGKLLFFNITPGGLLVSTDPVALDRACYDLLYNESWDNRNILLADIDVAHGSHLLDSAELLGAGTQQYFLINLED